MIYKIKVIKYLSLLSAISIIFIGCYAKRGYKHYPKHYSVSKSKELKATSDSVTITGNIYLLKNSPAEYAHYGIVNSDIKLNCKDGKFNFQVAPGTYSFYCWSMKQELTTRKIKIKAGYIYNFQIYLGGGVWSCA